MQEPQKNREVYTNNNDKELKERKNIKLPPLVFLTNVHKEIFKEVGEIAYRTWFMDVNIVEDTETIQLILIDQFKKSIIEEKYIRKLELILKKKIVVKIIER